MFIAPITRIDSLEQLNTISQTAAAPKGTLPFQSLLQDALTSVKESDQAVVNESIKLATGQSANPDDLTIASTKLSLSTELFIQIRNKVMDSYNEVMRMGV